MRGVLTVLWLVWGVEGGHECALRPVCTKRGSEGLAWSCLIFIQQPPKKEQHLLFTPDARVLVDIIERYAFDLVSGFLERGPGALLAIRNRRRAFPFLVRRPSLHPTPHHSRPPHHAQDPIPPSQAVVVASLS